MTRFGVVRVPGTELSISRLGLGAARLFAGRELRSSAKIVEAALLAGVTHFDTAPSYACGESEVALGELLAGHAGTTITTKIGAYGAIPKKTANAVAYRTLLRPALAAFPALKASLLRLRASMPRAQSIPKAQHILLRSQVTESVERSLQRLRRDTIDILLVHEPAEVLLSDALEQVLIDLVRQRLIKAYGLGYGGPVDAINPFGAVLQCAAEASDRERSPQTNTLRIVHGVLRSPMNAGRDIASLTARARLERALLSIHNGAVIFSASSAAQVNQVALNRI